MYFLLGRKQWKYFIVYRITQYTVSTIWTNWTEVLQVGGLTCRWQRHSVKTFLLRILNYSWAGQNPQGLQCRLKKKKKKKNWDWGSSVNQTVLVIKHACALLTYCMKHSPWEANQFSASQEIPHILWNPTVHYHIHTCTCMRILTSNTATDLGNGL